MQESDNHTEKIDVVLTKDSDTNYNSKNKSVDAASAASKDDNQNDVVLYKSKVEKMRFRKLCNEWKLVSVTRLKK